MQLLHLYFCIPEVIGGNNKVKRAIFITDQFMTGGVETVFLHISAYIEKKIILIPLHKKYNQKLVSSIPENVEINKEYPGISRSLVDFLKIPYLAFSQRKRLKVSRAEKVVNFSDTLSSLLFAYFLNPYNCISWIHCNPKALLKSKNSKLYFYLLSKCKQIVFLSNSQKALFFSLKESKNINYEKAKICTNFFNATEIMKESKQKVSKTENSYFFTAARLDLRSKDFVTLIDGYDKLPITIKNKYSLIIAGDGPDKEKIKKYILEKKLMDNIYLIGNQDNVYKYMSKAKLYIHSSVSEGFSMAILEALECGATVISSDCEVGPRELLLDGKYGFLYQVHNADDLSFKIRLALEKPIDRSKAIDRANQISNKGMEEIRSFFNE